MTPCLCTPSLAAELRKQYRSSAPDHAAGIALLAAERHGLEFREWVLVAPTWRGPFPTMAR